MDILRCTNFGRDILGYLANQVIDNLDASLRTSSLGIHTYEVLHRYNQPGTKCVVEFENEDARIGWASGAIGDHSKGMPILLSL